LLLLVAIAAVLGIAGGYAAWLLLHLIGLFTNVALFHRFGWDIPHFDDLHRSGWIVLAAVVGGAIVSVMAKWAPLIKGHGIPEAMEAVLTEDSRISPRTAVAKPLSAAVAIGTGGPFGAEGPIIVTGGALGSLIGQVISTSPSERKILLACGASAGMAATFGAPLASVMLAIELLLFEFSARALVPLVVASAVAAGVHYTAIGQGPLFPVPPQHYAGLGKLPLYALLGLLCGLAAVVINEGMFHIESGYRRLPVGEFWHPIIGAAAFALIGLAVPRSLGVGYAAIGDVLLGKLAAGTLAALCLAKLAAWWVALASRTSGGTIAPLLLISGCFGSLVGRGLDQVFPSLHISPGAFALVAMAATFGASVGATLTAIVFVFEITRDYHAILPLMLASVIAELVAGSLSRDSLMTEKLTRRGLRVRSDYQADVLATATVGQVMTTEVLTISAAASVGDARRLLHSSGHVGLPLLDEDGVCIGMVWRAQAFDPDRSDDEAVAEVASPEVAGVAPEALVLDAVEKLLDNPVEALPVLEGGEVVGIFVPTDVLRPRIEEFRYERLQDGWRPPWLRRRRQRRVPGSDDVGLVTPEEADSDQTTPGQDGSGDDQP
jgi:H+/Cl- antiporter ClcA